MDNSMLEKINFFNQAKEVCMKKLKIEASERPISFLRALKELQFRFPKIEGACEILYDFYHGSDDYEEEELKMALEVIEKA